MNDRVERLKTRLFARPLTTADLTWLLAVVYLCWPAPEAHLLTGIPLQTPAIAALGLLAWGVAFGRDLLGRRRLTYAVVLLLVLRVLVNAGTVPLGWQARYYRTPDLTGEQVRSIDFRTAPWTRIDRRIDFFGDSFPLHYMNELAYNNADWKRATSFSVRWVGHVHTDVDRDVALDLDWINHATVLIDDQVRLDETSPERTATRRTAVVPLRAGRHVVEVRYFTRNYESPGIRFELRSPTAAAATREPPLVVYAEPFTAGRLEMARAARIGLLFTDAAILIGLLALAGVTLRQIVRPARATHGAGWPRSGIVPAIALVICLMPALISVRWDATPSAMINVPSGTDALTYESYARESILESPLLNAGHIKGKPYEYTIGYHYFVSLAHLTLGESVINVFQANETLFFIALVLNAIVAGRLAGRHAAIVSVAITLYCKYAVFWESSYVFKENLIILTNAWLAYVVSRADRVTARHALLVGLVTGLNCITDPINLAITPIVLGVVLWQSAPEGRLKHAACVVLACCAVLSIVPLRNLIVTGFPTPLPVEGRSALWFGNQPPPGVVKEPYGHDELLQVVLAYLRAEPGLFFYRIVEKGVYAMGLYGLRFRTTDWAEVFAPVMLLAWIGVFVGLSRAWHAARWSIVLIAMGLMRGAVMAVFVSYMDVDRYETPWLITVTPLLAATIVWIWQYSRVTVIAALVIIGAWDYYRVFPALAHAPFTERRMLWSPSYGALRQKVQKDYPGGEWTWTWTMPGDLGKWRGGDRVFPVRLDDRVFVHVTLPSGGGLFTSPQLGLPAPLVKSIRIEAGFSGWWHYASIRFHRRGEQRLFFANFPVDKTGRVQRYEIPVSRSEDWFGVIDEIGVFYFGEQFELKSVHLVSFDE